MHPSVKLSMPAVSAAAVVTVFSSIIMIVAAVAFR